MKTQESESKPALKVGDVVKLNSGGPKMCLEEINGAQAACVWYSEPEFKRSKFPVSDLRLADPE